MRKKVFPKLYALASNGKQKEWQVSVHEQEEDGLCLIRRVHGFTDNKMQTIEKAVTSGKNIGRSNETTIFEQAVSDAQSLWNKKKDSAYTETAPKKKDPVPLPMLALPFKKRKHDIEYPCYVQPKLNGCRVFARKIDKSTIEYTSRNGKKYETLGHLTPKLLSVMEAGDILDGEVYVHGMHFQQIIRLLKKLRPESKDLQYHVYDKAEMKTPYHDRLVWLENKFGWEGEIVVVHTHMAICEEDVYKYHSDFVKDGYEGVIVRNKKGKYKFRHRSKDLQKYKEFKDEEFKIVGCKEGTGIHEGCAVLECCLENGCTFFVYPKGTLEHRKKLLKDMDKIIGKDLTVRYQDVSEDGVPIFPVGIAIRDYE